VVSEIGDQGFLTEELIQGVYTFSEIELNFEIDVNLK